MSSKKSGVWLSTLKSTKLFGGLMYHDRSECTAVLSMVESKRRCWFQNELEASRREWVHYKKWLRGSIRELARVENLVRCSYEAFDGYSKNVDAICDEAFVNDNGDILTKKERVKLQKQRIDISTDAEMIDANPLLGPMIESFANLKKELDTHVPPMEANVLEATELKNEIAAKVKALEDKGNSIGSAAVDRAEANIQEAFDALMNVADWYEHSGPSDDAEPDDMKDRWLLESLYRNSANLGLETWKTNRREYQNLYAEIIQLDEDRRGCVKQILLSFLPRRKKLMDSAQGALVPGSKAEKTSKSKESEEIEITLEKLSRSKSLRDTSQHRSRLWEDAKKQDSVAEPDCYPPSLGNDLWVSSYAKERRVFEMKVNKEWKTVVGVITLDNYLHIFSVTEDSKTDESTDCDNAKVTLQEAKQSLKSLIPEFSVKLADFDIAVLPDAMEIELLRKIRSKIFRKRDDQIVLKLGNDDEVSQWVGSITPPMETGKLVEV